MRILTELHKVFRLKYVYENQARGPDEIGHCAMRVLHGLMGTAREPHTNNPWRERIARLKKDGSWHRDRWIYEGRLAP